MGAAATGSDGGSNRQQWQQQGAVKAPATARAVSTVGGCTWRHLGSFLVLLGLTWCHSVSRGVNQFHSDLVLCHLVSLGVTRCHSVSLGVTRFHLVSLGFTFGFTWCNLVSLGVTFVSLGLARCHLVSQKPGYLDSRVCSRMTCVRSGVLRRSDGVFFLTSKKKRPLGVTWIHFFATKQVFQEVAGMCQISEIYQTYTPLYRS